MEVREIELDKLVVSDLNVRKTLTSEEDETGISDLSNDIRVNGLINPITVRRLPGQDKYEIFAGQRRFLATKLLQRTTISCSIMDVTSQKAEELSLVENVQRNPMTNSDKVKTYSKLYEVYNKDIDKVISVINISRPTLQKYLKLKDLDEAIIKMLDSNSDSKITIDVAVELTKLPDSVDKLEVIQNIQTLSTAQQKTTLKQFIADGSSDIDDLIDIKKDVLIQQNNIVLAPSFPYVKDTDGKNVKIPQHLFEDVIALIQTRCGRLEYI